MPREVIATVNAETENEDVEGAVGGDDIEDVDDIGRMPLVEMQTSGQVNRHKGKLEVRDMAANKSSKSPTMTIGKMDRLLDFCFGSAISALSQKDLPIQASTFFGTHMMKYCPAGEHLDIKQSSYKKLPKFMKKQEKNGVIKIKELSKGAESIVRMDNSHPMLKGFKVSDMDKRRSISSKNAEKQPGTGVPVVTELFEITADVLPLFEDLGYKEGSILKKADVTKIITNYIREKGLDQEDSKRLLRKMTPVCEIRTEGQPPVLKKGTIDPIKVDVIERSADKLMTVIENLDSFGVNLEEFSHRVHDRLACGAFVASSRNENKIPFVIVQGNKTDRVRDLLLDEYKIPRTYLRIIVHGGHEDNMRQYTLRNCLRITGIKESYGEDTDKIVLDIATALNVGICKDDIDWSDRIGAARVGTHRAIVAAFTSMEALQKLFKKRLYLRKLQTGRWENVYINEDLTAYRSKLFYHARQYRRANLIKYAFSSEGNVYVVDLTGTKHQINNSEELNMFGVLDSPFKI